MKANGLSQLPFTNELDSGWGVTMASISKLKRWYTCLECDEPFVAPEHSDFINADEVHNLWVCDVCGFVLETTFTVQRPPVKAALPVLIG
jgi:hypothetical protein